LRLDSAPVTVLLLLAVLAAVQLVHYHPLLPDTIAVHFGSDGEPNGWSAKTEFAIVYGVIEAFFVLFGIAFAVLLERIPHAFVNIPNREYWFSPERRAETLEFLRNKLLWIQVSTLAFLIVIAQLVFRENLGGSSPRLPGSFWYVLAAFVAVMVWLALTIVFRFIPKRGGAPS
jgi:uncharacterized membrane protein